MNTIERFNQFAIKYNLSAGAILLWQYLFFTMQRKNQFADVQQHTAVLLAVLNVSRQGLQNMRQMLIDNGFLAIRQDEHQQIFYTLMIDGKAVEEKEKSSFSETSGTTSPEGQGSDKPLCSIKEPSPRENLQKEGMAERPSGDIILTNQYRPYIRQFCEVYGLEVKNDLMQWAEMRRQNGWTLTLWGLETMMKNLIELSGGDAVQMRSIVAQSVTNRWKGFFSLKVKPKPSGAKLLAEEAKQNNISSKKYGYPDNYNRKPVQKFKPEGRDLSFLEI
ncbi:MAG: hypothetical protein IJA90_08985 [Peptococcaceae bacterium]|nr:hypothetical protein [Peptococcaceae bacterium]